MGKIEEGRGGKTGFLGSEGSNDGMKSKSRNGCGIGDGTGIFLGVSIGENWGILSVSPHFPYTKFMHFKTLFWLLSISSM